MPWITTNSIISNQVKIILSTKYLLKRYTSLARGTRPSTVLTTDQVRVDMLRTRVSDTPVERSMS